MRNGRRLIRVKPSDFAHYYQAQSVRFMQSMIECEVKSILEKTMDVKFRTSTVNERYIISEPIHQST